MAFNVISRTACIVSFALASGCAPQSTPSTATAPLPASQSAEAFAAPNSHPSATLSSTRGTSQSQSVRTYIDAVTGEQRDPTPAELAAEAERAKNKAPIAAPTQSKQQEIFLPDGSVEIVLDKSAQRPLRACIQENGELKMDHACEAPNHAKANGANR